MVFLGMSDLLLEPPVLALLLGLLLQVGYVGQEFMIKRKARAKN